MPLLGGAPAGVRSAGILRHDGLGNRRVEDKRLGGAELTPAVRARVVSANQQNSHAARQVRRTLSAEFRVIRKGAGCGEGVSVLSVRYATTPHTSDALTVLGTHPKPLPLWPTQGHSGWAWKSE